MSFSAWNIPFRGDMQKSPTRAAHAPWISAGVVTLPERLLGFTKGLLVRDPDGHVIQLVEQWPPLRRSRIT